MAEDESGEEYADNGERAIFFARGVLETVKKLRWTPDIIHCQGWMSGVVPLYVKTAYHDEPCFANTKVITSLFEDQLKNDLGQNFKRCLEFRDVKQELLSAYSNDFDFLELGKLAIDYSDGIVEAGAKVNAELMGYAASKSKPILSYPGTDDISSKYKEFYEQILPTV